MREQSSLNTPISRCWYCGAFSPPGGMHGGHAIPGPQRRKPDHIQQAERLQLFAIKPAFEQFVPLHGEGADVADIRDDSRSSHWTLRIVLFKLFQEFRLVSEHEQLIVLHVPHVVNAYSARRAFTQVGNPAASRQPKLRIERAVIDRADRLG